MQKIIIALASILLALILGCTGSSKTTAGSDKRPLRFRAQAGFNTGGIVENTNKKDFANAPVDAFTGATKLGYNVGTHVLIPVWKHALETGVDYMINNQTFTYKHPEIGYMGERTISTSQFMIPFMASFSMCKKNNPEGNLQLKFGYVAQYNILSVSDQGLLPDYSVNHFSGGFGFGISATPWKFKNGARMGFYVDLYRGTQIYKDFYNQSSFKMPGSSYGKFGIIYQFK